MNSNIPTELLGSIISTLHRHEAQIQAFRVLSIALIETHPNPAELQVKLLDGMDLIADSVKKEDIPMYRVELDLLQQKIRDEVLKRNPPSKQD